MPESKGKLPYDDFVSKVVKDPKQPPDALLLTGYLGESSEEGHTRLHFDPELKNYVEIPNDAVLHTQPIPKESSSLGGHHVWIKRDAELIHGTVGPERTKAKFFEGPIAAAVGAAGVGAGPVTALPAGCPVTAPTACACPLTIIPIQCPTQPLHCPPPTPLCPVTLLHGCVSPLPHCPPSPPPLLCPHTPLHGCPSPLPHCVPTPTCPVTPVLGCPSPLPHCPPSPPPLLCPVTPVHGCPSPLLHCPPSPPPLLCPITPAHGCPTPPNLCPTPTAIHLCPTPPNLCPTPTVLQHCVTQTCPSLHVPCISAPNC